MKIYSLQQPLILPNDIMIVIVNTTTNNVYIIDVYERFYEYNYENTEYIVENNRLISTDKEIFIIFQTTDETEFKQYLENFKLIKTL